MGFIANKKPSRLPVFSENLFFFGNSEENILQRRRSRRFKNSEIQAADKRWRHARALRGNRWKLQNFFYLFCCCDEIIAALFTISQTGIQMALRERNIHRWIFMSIRQALMIHIHPHRPRRRLGCKHRENARTSG